MYSIVGTKDSILIDEVTSFQESIIERFHRLAGYTGVTVTIVLLFCKRSTIKYH